MGEGKLFVSPLETPEGAEKNLSQMIMFLRQTIHQVWCKSIHEDLQLDDT